METSARRASPVVIAVAGLVALAIAMGIGRFAFTPILPMMQEDAGLSVTAGGWLASANYFGYLVGALSAIALEVRATTVIRGALLSIAVVTAAMGLTSDFIAWLILRALAGVASAWVLVFVSAWSLERLAAARRAALNGVVFAGVGAGIALAGLGCLILMHLRATSGTAWIIFGVLSLLLSFAVWPVYASGSRPISPRSATNPIDAVRHDNRGSIVLIFCYGVFGFGYIIPATFLPAMAKQIIPDPAVFGWSWPVFGAAAMLSALAVPGLRRLGANRRLWIAGHTLMAIGVVLPVFWTGIVAIILAALLVGGTLMLVTMAAIQEARDVTGARARGLIAAMTAGFAIGQIVGPIAASYTVASSGSFSTALLTAAALLAAGAWALSRAKYAA